MLKPHAHIETQWSIEYTIPMAVASKYTHVVVATHPSEISIELSIDRSISSIETRYLVEFQHGMRWWRRDNVYMNAREIEIRWWLMIRDHLSNQANHICNATKRTVLRKWYRDKISWHTLFHQTFVRTRVTSSERACVSMQRNSFLLSLIVFVPYPWHLSHVDAHPREVLTRQQLR